MEEHINRCFISIQLILDRGTLYMNGDADRLYEQFWEMAILMEVTGTEMYEIIDAALVIVKKKGYSIPEFFDKARFRLLWDVIE